MIFLITTIALAAYGIYAYMQTSKFKTRNQELESITTAMQAANASLVEDLIICKRAAQSVNDKLKAAKTKASTTTKTAAKPAKEKVEKKVAKKK